MILKKHILLPLFVLLVTFNFQAQQTKIYTDKYKPYRDGLELYDKQMYSAAQEKFTTTIKAIDNSQDEIQINAEFLKAKCALYLFNLDAQFLLSQFVIDHPDAPQAKKVPFILGRDFYRKKEYRDAIFWFEKVDEYDLTTSEIIEFHFKYGYSLFNKDKMELAKQHFYEIKDIESEYFGAANYYYGHIAYTEENYQTALESFQKIDGTPDFGPIVPYYIAQILYNQSKFQEVIEYVPPILEREKVKREGEIRGIIGSAYFKKKQYKNAIPYLEAYFRDAKTRTIDDYYQLGFSYYQVKDYDNAIKYLGRVAANEDKRAQVCNYILAESYIKTDNKEYAKAAFKRAYDLGFDPSINEDALFGYAKSTYETAYNPYDGATDIFHKFLDEFPKSTKKQTVYEYLLDMYTTTKDYEAALNSINKIQDKNFQIKEAYQKLSYNRGVELFYKEDLDAALVNFNNVKKYNVSPLMNAESKFWIAEINSKQGKYSEAINGYKAFKTTTGSQSSSLYDIVDYNIGYAYFNQAKYEDAAGAFRTFASNTKDIERKADANLRLGDAYFVLKEDANASKYYGRAIVENTGNNDYAIYQKAIVAGYMQDGNEKERLLSQLLREYPNSVYAKSSQYELANTYSNQRKDKEAIKLYQDIIDNYPDNEQKRKAMLNIGGIHLRNENYGDAEDVFERIIKNYPNTTEADASLNELERAYILQNKIDEFPDLLNRLGIKYSESKLDSTLWEPAKKAYLSGDCNNASLALQSYLNKIKSPRHYSTAYFYLGECAYLKEELEKALTYYNVVIVKNGQHLEDALYHAGNISYKLKNYQKTYEYFVQLEPINTDENRTPVLYKGLMRTAYDIKQYTQAIKYAGKVLSDVGTKGNLEEEATMIKAKSNFELGEFIIAKPLFKKVVSISNNVNKAEAKYRICEILYNEKQYKQSEDELFELIKQKPTYDYWLAKGFILLADVYVKLGDNFQAKATLKSVIENYTADDDIIPIANEKLKLINALEKAGDVKPGDDVIDINNSGK